jgi:hypothetical protein
MSDFNQASFLVIDALVVTRWITDIAPVINCVLNLLFFTCRPIVPILALPPDECCIGVNPMHADASFPFVNVPSSAQPNAMYRLTAFNGPTP